MPISHASRGALLLRRAELLEEQARIDRELAQLEMTSADEYSSLLLPPDARNADAFHRACRSGRVIGASKRGRVWICSRAAWESRSAAPAPRIASRPALAPVDADVLAELGARRAS